MKNFEIEEFIGRDKINRGKHKQIRKYYRKRLGRKKSHHEIVQIHKEDVNYR